MKKKIIISIDLGGTHFRIGLIDFAGNILDFSKHKTSMLDKANPVDTFINVIEDFWVKGSKMGEVMALAVGLPATISKDKRVVYNCPNLDGFDGVDLKTLLENKFNLTVFIERDVIFLLEYDIKTLDLDDSTVLGFYIGTGFGNAIFLNNSYYTGVHGSAGELGHIPYYGVDSRCGCGNTGCAETKSSGIYLKKLVETKFPNIKLNDIFVQKGGDKEIIDFVKHLAIPIVTESNILDPAVIVLSGGVINMKSFPNALLNESIRGALRRPFPHDDLNILYSVHIPETGVLGGMYYAKRMLENDK